MSGGLVTPCTCRRVGLQRRGAGGIISSEGVWRAIGGGLSAQGIERAGAEEGPSSHLDGRGVSVWIDWERAVWSASASGSAGARGQVFGGKGDPKRAMQELGTSCGSPVLKNGLTSHLMSKASEHAGCWV